MACVAGPGREGSTVGGDLSEAFSGLEGDAGQEWY